ncbi:MAG: hypothetical protein V1701_02670 [Planctomycetota bacterium]
MQEQLFQAETAKRKRAKKDKPLFPVVPNMVEGKYLCLALKSRHKPEYKGKTLIEIANIEKAKLTADTRG